MSELFNPADPILTLKKSAFLQRIARSVKHGSHLYLNGQTKFDKLPQLTQKLAHRYPINLPEHKQSRRKKQKLGTWKWYGYVLPHNPQKVIWVLLYCPGSELDESDQWKHVFKRGQYLNIDGLELVRITRKGKEKPVLTWRMNRSNYDRLRDKIVTAVRHQDQHDLEALFLMISKLPGFSELREQVYKLKELARKEWMRRIPDTHEVPDYLKRKHHFLRRLKVPEKKWSDIKKALPKEG